MFRKAARVRFIFLPSPDMRIEIAEEIYMPRICRVAEVVYEISMCLPHILWVYVSISQVAWEVTVHAADIYSAGSVIYFYP